MAAQLLAVAAVAFMAPHMNKDQIRNFQNNYPTEAVRNDWSLIATIEMKVDPRGVIVECALDSISGPKQFADKICALFRSAGIESAEINGSPSYGVYRALFSFCLLDVAGKKICAIRPPADLDLTVDVLPKKDKTGGRMDVEVLVNAAGKVEDCVGGEHAQQPYAQLACQQTKDMAFPILEDSAGQPVSYVRKVPIQLRLNVARQSSATK